MRALLCTAALLLVAGCTTTSVSTATPPAPAPASASPSESTEEIAFMATVWYGAPQLAHVPVTSELKIGHTICQDIPTSSYDQLIYTLEAAGDTAQSATIEVNAAVVALCPQYKAKLPG